MTALIIGTVLFGFVSLAIALRSFGQLKQAENDLDRKEAEYSDYKLTVNKQLIEHTGNLQRSISTTNSHARRIRRLETEISHFKEVAEKARRNERIMRLKMVNGFQIHNIKIQEPASQELANLVISEDPVRIHKYIYNAEK